MDVFGAPARLTSVSPPAPTVASACPIRTQLEGGTTCEHDSPSSLRRWPRSPRSRWAARHSRRRARRRTRRPRRPSRPRHRAGRRQHRLSIPTTSSKATSRPLTAATQRRKPPPSRPARRVSRPQSPGLATAPAATRTRTRTPTRNSKASTSSSLLGRYSKLRGSGSIGTSEPAYDFRDVPVDVQTEVEINRLRDEVAAYASDPDKATEWYENIKAVEWRSPRPLAVGSEI